MYEVFPQRYPEATETGVSILSSVCQHVLHFEWSVGVSGATCGSSAINQGQFVMGIRNFQHFQQIRLVHPGNTRKHVFIFWENSKTFVM